MQYYEENLLADNSVLKKMVNTYIVGWISPEGVIYEVPVYQHLEFLSKILPWVKAEYEKIGDEINAGYWEHYNSITEGEHPEWHVYEIWADDYKREECEKIYQKLYKAGWVRFGTFNEYRAKRQVIEYQTTEYWYTQYKNYLKGLADIIERLPKFEKNS